MFTKKVKWFISLGLVIAISGLLVAQTPGMGTQDQQQNADQQRQQTTPPGQRQTMPDQQQRQQQLQQQLQQLQQQRQQAAGQAQGQLNLVQAGKLLGADVKNAQGQTIGSVENLALHTGQDRVQYAVLALNEDQFQQAGNALYLVPWQSLSFQEQAGEFSATANLSQSDVQQSKRVQADWSEQLGNREVKLITTAQTGRTQGAAGMRMQPGQRDANGETNGNGVWQQRQRPSDTNGDADKAKEYGTNGNGDADKAHKESYGTNGDSNGYGDKEKDKEWQEKQTLGTNGEADKAKEYGTNGDADKAKEWDKKQQEGMNGNGESKSYQGTNGNGEAHSPYGSSATQSRQTSPSASAHQQAGSQNQFVLASRLIGMSIQDQQNDSFAEVQGMVIDKRTGHVAFGVVSWGGFFGIGEQWALVPWNSLNFQYDQNVAQLNADRQILTTIAFDPDQFPNLENREYTTNLYSRFNEQPYWTVYGFAGEDTGTQQQQIDQLTQQRQQQQRDWSAWQPESAYIRQFNPQTVTTVQGTIENIGSFYPSPNAPAGMSLRVQTQDGQRTVVNLGPRPFIMDQNIQLHSGDQVTVTGSKVNIQGREVLVATELRKDGQTVQIRDQQGRPQWDVSKLQQGATGTSGRQQPGQQPGRGPLGTNGEVNGETNGDAEHQYKDSDKDHMKNGNGEKDSYQIQPDQPGNGEEDPYQYRPDQPGNGERQDVESQSEIEQQV